MIKENKEFFDTLTSEEIETIKKWVASDREIKRRKNEAKKLFEEIISKMKEFELMGYTFQTGVLIVIIIIFGILKLKM